MLLTSSSLIIVNDLNDRRLTLSRVARKNRHQELCLGSFDRRRRFHAKLR